MATAPPLSESSPTIAADTFAPPELRTCNGCRRELALTSFPFKNKAAGKRHLTCQDCSNRYRRERWKPRRRRNDLSKQVTALASNENRDDVRLLAAVVRQMMRRFGGLDRMCEIWAEHIKAAAVSRPGGRLVLKTFQAISHLTMAVEAAQIAEWDRNRVEAAALNSDELGDLIVSLLER